MQKALASHIIVFVSAGFFALNCQAVEKLTANQFLSACLSSAQITARTDKSSPAADRDINRVLCESYIHGFLAATEIYTATDGKMSLQDKALKTRARNLLENKNHYRGERYCLSENLSVGDIVTLINQTPLASDSHAYAESIVETVLSQHYPCSN